MYCEEPTTPDHEPVSISFASAQDVATTRQQLRERMMGTNAMTAALELPPPKPLQKLFAPDDCPDRPEGTVSSANVQLAFPEAFEIAALRKRLREKAKAEGLWIGNDEKGCHIEGSGDYYKLACTD